MKLQDALTAKLLSEARSNPELNPKISAYMALRPYSNNDDYYISFTEIDKIGIYPQSQFRTPLGIYAYPLKEIWELYNIDRERSIGKSVPFAGERPHIWLLKIKKGIKFVNSASSYKDSMYERDLATLYDYVLKNKEIYYKSFGVETPEELKENVIYKAFSTWEKEAKFDIGVSKLWNITRNLSFRGRDVDNCSNKERTSIITNWNTLFYKVLGYYGFADKTGTGYIHPSEPVQAVFFTRTAFEIEKEVLNKDYDAETIWIKTSIENKTIEVENPSFSIGKYQTVIWKSGIWKTGIWKSGIWKSGTWHNGTWRNGTWEYGTWKNGVWLQGTWYDGTWYNGTWKSGSWEDGTWENGTWEYGTWKNGVWLQGTWYDGTWYNGTWHNGTWYGGTWYDGTWKNGTWEYGIWGDGIWEGGLWEGGLWNDGTWKGGTWKDGWIADPNQEGNSKPEWEWKRGYYVKSPISPAEYWKAKEN